jgi:predicted alpha-1,2-mannosidase
VSYYNSKGYIPYDVKIDENVARTLEYAYADFCIWKLGMALNRPKEETDRFAARCQNYRNVFDSTTLLMRGRNLNGSFQSPFSPFKWGDAFTEGNSWHYTWSVFHDIQGLIDLMGGAHSFTSILDSVFKVQPVFDDSYYGFPIHEIREMQIMNMGNYAHGNQPIQHMVYLYEYAGQPWKTQYHVREIMNRLYTPAPDGYCGDEDNGQTSAWYVFSAMGFYPVCPGSNQYVIGAPLFRKIKIFLSNGKTVEINGNNNSAENRYVSGIKLNDKEIGKTWISHAELLNGCTLDFNMVPAPVQSPGGKDAVPFSFSSVQNK